MWFGVLGPLEVRAEDGGPVRIREVKVRALLADLLQHLGRPVSVDRLVEDLWGERAPADPAQAVQTRIWQLRKAIGRDLVVSTGSGYLLRAEPDSVDLWRFQALLEQAGASAEPAVRAELLTDALALWRGPAFAEFADAEFTRITVGRLEELRLTAVEDHAEARLALGADLTAELGELVARHPLRERLHGIRLRALYRAGRQGEALAAYAELRRRLAEELGVDPGPELLALHQAILTRSPELAVRPRTNLPAPAAELIGREEAVTAVGALLARARLVTLTGPGGVGKTRLAIEAARRLDPPDGVWLAELAAAGEVLDVVTAVLGVRDLDALRERNLVLLLDNCEHLLDPAAGLLTRLLAVAPGVRVLATSREPLAVPGEHRFPVPPLAPAEAAELFTARAAAAAPGARLDPAAVAVICRRLDGLPLALELAATRVPALGVRALADRLDDRFSLLDNGNRGAPARQRTLRAVIDWSWQPLSEQERAALCRLSVLADGGDLAAAEAVCALPGTLNLVAGLVDRSLVVMAETADGPRYRLLESVAAFAAEQLDPAEQQRLRQRHQAHYLALAEEADRHLRGPQQRIWLRRLDIESANLRRALTGPAPAALRLANALGWYWYLRGRYGEAHRTLTALLDTPGHDTDAVRAEASAWVAAFALLIRDPDLPEPADPDLSPIAQESRRTHLEWFLGLARSDFGPPAATAAWAERAHAAFTAAGERWGAAATLHTRAALALAAGDLTTARALGAECAARFLDLGDRWGQLKAGQIDTLLAQIGGDYPAAARGHERALRLAESLGLWTEAAYEYAGLGRLALLTGELARAEELHTVAARLATEQSHQRGRQFAEVGLGLIARRRGEFAAAERWLRSWLDWCRRFDGAAGVALILAELGFLAEQRGQAAECLALHREGLAAAQAVGDPRAVALALEGLAGAHALAGDRQLAAESLARATGLRASVGAPLPPGERGDVERIARLIRTGTRPDPVPPRC
ncbi:BTAD domain-containing putative transcriptional regulator [Crossiella sp. CA-258035]|uniref:BTAD domain-containing putative transcriptional regulator n=1 Tax=Crossiella sp. CA-258035 TaxID=2981138 RepID=UPI0024BCAA98|nr:BTAD domain-containing putative transcriptional regulator [Crossiella sp. CA-258035]WHT21920.1 BTAD domain-containing putative transcriptional regulator [Crossiella sp. CA-258035]